MADLLQRLCKNNYSYPNSPCLASSLVAVRQRYPMGAGFVYYEQFTKKKKLLQHFLDKLLLF